MNFRHTSAENFLLWNHQPVRHFFQKCIDNLSTQSSVSYLISDLSCIWSKPLKLTLGKLAKHSSEELKPLVQ